MQSQAAHRPIRRSRVPRIPAKPSTCSGDVVHLSERSDCRIGIVPSRGRYGQGGIKLPSRFPFQLEPIGAVNQVIQDGIADGRIREAGGPVSDRDLRGDQGRRPAAAVNQDIEQVFETGKGSGGRGASHRPERPGEDKKLSTSDLKRRATHGLPAPSLNRVPEPSAFAEDGDEEGSTSSRAYSRTEQQILQLRCS